MIILKALFCRRCVFYWIDKEQRLCSLRIYELLVTINIVRFYLLWYIRALVDLEAHHTGIKIPPHRLNSKEVLLCVVFGWHLLREYSYPSMIVSFPVVVFCNFDLITLIKLRKIDVWITVIVRRPRFYIYLITFLWMAFGLKPEVLHLMALRLDLDLLIIIDFRYFLALH